MVAPHFGHIKGTVKVRQLHCKPLSMVTGQGRHTTTLSGDEEVTGCRDRGRLTRDKSETHKLHNVLDAHACYGDNIQMEC